MLARHGMPGYSPRVDALDVNPQCNVCNPREGYGRGY